MRKRERENPCGICGHYHKYEEGEVCGVCGHRMALPASPDNSAADSPPSARPTDSAFPSEIVKDSIYLGSYDNASRSELLKAIGISHILNTVPACQNLYRNSFTYQCLADDKILQFDEANTFLEQCEREKARVLVHCMSGKNRSAAVVVAFLMKSRGWRLEQSFQWVKEHRPQVNITSAFQLQLVEYEQKLFGTNVVGAPSFAPGNALFPSLGFGFPKPPDAVPVPAFTQAAPSIFDRSESSAIPSNFTFGAGTATGNNNLSILSPAGSETHARMDST